MAHPKRQHSRQRQRKRRTHYGASVPSFALCSQCKGSILPHRVCPFCGYYKGQPVIEIKQKEEAGKS
ncbi:MAG: 50S ribosomal protein L32 [Candidatus Omnitrophica bacterium]|nr:50S ribosomal protein L32 [Candidatus Omnitrophota bacterium]